MSKTPHAGASWFSFLIAAAAIGFLAWHIPIDRERYVSLFSTFKLELPDLTKKALSIPQQGIVAGGAGLIFLAFLVQVSARNKAGAAVFHMFLVMVCCLVFCVYREAMMQPMIGLIQSIAKH